MNNQKIPTYKNAIILLLVGMVVLVTCISQNERYKRLENQSEVMELRIENDSLKVANNDLNLIIWNSSRASVRMQYNLGVDTLDGVVTYKQKMLVSAKDIQRLNKVKLNK
jgi:hypothetical protein